MADQTLKANRLGFLDGGAFAVAAVATVSIPAIPMARAAPSRAAWNAALDNIARAEAALEATHPAFNRTEALYWSLQPKPPTVEELLTGSGDPAQPLDDVIERGWAVKADYERRDELVRQQTGHAEAARAQHDAVDRVRAAVEALVLLPAPDFAAVACKIELARNESMDLHDLDPVLADLHRLGRAA